MSGIDDIRSRAGQLLGRAKDKAEEYYPKVRDTAEAVYGEVKDKAEEYYPKVKEKASDVLGEVKARIDDITESKPHPVVEVKDGVAVVDGEKPISTDEPTPPPSTPPAG